MLTATDGTPLPKHTIELDRLPEVGTALRPPLAPVACFVTRSVPASIEATGDIRIAGTVHADVLDEPGTQG